MIRVLEDTPITEHEIEHLYSQSSGELEVEVEHPEALAVPVEVENDSSSTSLSYTSFSSVGGQEEKNESGTKNTHNNKVSTHIEEQQIAVQQVNTKNVVRSICKLGKTFIRVPLAVYRDMLKKNQGIVAVERQLHLFIKQLLAFLERNHHELEYRST